MNRGLAGFRPPFCPNPDCAFHRNPGGWRHKRIGFFVRRAVPRRIQRFLCLHCRRSFSSQTFQLSYWLKLPHLLNPLFWGALSCSGYRQMARALDVSPNTVAHQVERLGRHCLLFHAHHGPAGRPTEPLVLDGLETFEFSQYWPFHINVVVGAESHFVYAFGDAELRRKGRMTAAQRRRRAELEARYGRPDPRAVEHSVAELVQQVAGEGPGPLVVCSDEHRAYPRALRRIQEVTIRHQTISSKAPRTRHNPLFPVNLLDLLTRHCSANHKRETIAFSKRRLGAQRRMAILAVWRNWMKSFSERNRDDSPAQRLGIATRRLRLKEILAQRLFPSRVPLSGAAARYYQGTVPTRQVRSRPPALPRYAA